MVHYVNLIGVQKDGGKETIKLVRCHNVVDYHNWLLSRKQNEIIMAAQCLSHLNFYRRGFGDSLKLN